MDTLGIIREQLITLRGEGARQAGRETVMSQVVDSRSFLTLLIGLEKALGITVSDEDFYERAPVTVGDLADLLDDVSGQSKAPITDELSPTVTGAPA